MLLEREGTSIKQYVLGNTKLGETVFTQYGTNIAKPSVEKNIKNLVCPECPLTNQKKADIIPLPNAISSSAFVAPFVKWSHFTSPLTVKPKQQDHNTALNGGCMLSPKVTKSEIFQLPKHFHGRTNTNNGKNVRKKKQPKSSSKTGSVRPSQNFYTDISFLQSKDFKNKPPSTLKAAEKHPHTSCGFYKKGTYFLPSAPYASKQYSRDAKKREEKARASPIKTEFFACPYKAKLKSLQREDTNVALPPSIINSISPLEVLQTEPTFTNVRRKAFTSHDSREGKKQNYCERRVLRNPLSGNHLGDRLSLIHFYGTDYENMAEQKMLEEKREMALLKKELKRAEKVGKEKQKRDQRKKIRALNRLMTQLELEKFEQFMSDFATTAEDDAL